MNSESIVHALSELRARNLSDEDYIEELVELWEDAQTSNRDLSTDDLAQDRPHLASPLARKIALLQRFSKRVQTSVPGLPTAALSGSRYQLCKDGYVASGGLGDIFRVHDSTLDRDVALKRPQDRWQSQRDVLQRLEREARLTAKLEHPGIVPTYEYGTDATGRPYYVMRLIQGTSLRDAIAALHEKTDSESSGDSGFQLRALVQRLVSVCNALAYAHSRRVIHRDVKPDNVMLGEFGETFLVDWGLAAELDSGKSAMHETTIDATADHSGTQTRPGREMGTYGFMSPEQANGRWNEVGPASDIFSLGATLYALLTNQPPYSGANKAEQARAGRYDPPQKIAPAVSPVLAAICCKAMSVRIDDRYQTALEMAADLERWLADEPISCFRDSRITTLFRWIRRHRVLSSAGIATVLVTSIALGIGMTVLTAKNEAVTAAKDQGQLAISILSSVILDLEGGLKDVPGGGKVRRRLLATSLEKLNSVSTQFLAKSLVDRSTMQAFNDMGDVVLTFGAESSGGLSQKEPDGGEKPSAVELAKKYYERGREIAVLLHQAAPSDPDNRRNLLVSSQKLGDVFLRLGRMEDAIKAFEESLRISQALFDETPDNTDAQRNVAISFERLGDIALVRGKTDEAMQYFTRELDVAEKLLNSDPSNAKQKSFVAIVHRKLGGVLLQQGNLDDALLQFQVDLMLNRELVATDSIDAINQRNLSIAHNNMGDLSLMTGRTQDALQHFEEAQTICRKLADDDPTDSGKLRDLAVSYERLGRGSLTLGQVENAFQHFTDELEIANRRMKADPEDADAKRFASLAYIYCGDVLQKLGRTDDALKHFENSLKISQKLAEDDPANSQKQHDQIVSHERIADIYIETGRSEDALRNYDNCLSIARRLAEQDPVSFENQRNVSLALNQIGKVLLRSGRTNDAMQYFEDSLKTVRRLAAVEPGNFQVQRDLIVGELQIGDILPTLGRAEESLSYYHRALQIALALTEADPDDAESQRSLSLSYERIGKALLEQGKLNEALDQFENKQRVDAAILKIDPSNILSQIDLSNAVSKIGDVYLSLNRPNEALQQFGQALRLVQAVVEANPANMEQQRNLAGAYERLGMASLASGNNNNALLYFTQELEIAERREKSDPADAEAKQFKSVVHNFIGMTLLRLDRSEDAVLHFETGLEICETAAEADPENLEKQRNLLIAYSNLGLHYLKSNWTNETVGDSLDKAEQHYQSAVAVFDYMIEHGRQTPNAQQQQQEKSVIEGRLQYLRACKVSLGDWDMIMQENAVQQAPLLELRGQNCVRIKRFDDAEQAARKLTELPQATFGQIYNAACVLSLCAASIQPEEGKELAPEKSEKRSQLLTEAIETLKQSIEKGWTDFAHMQQNPDLALLRELPEFQALIPASDSATTIDSKE